MPPPIPVELLPHDPAWPANAADATAQLARALGGCLVTVHHIGSTAIPGIHAKPILDLMPEVRDLAGLDAHRAAVEALGYQWWGAYGLPGRRYCTWADPATGRRRVQIHCYVQGSPEIVRHLAFRDYLRSHQAIAAAYDREKKRCRDLHPQDSHAYADCKGDWIKRTEAEALDWYRGRGAESMPAVPYR